MSNVSPTYDSFDSVIFGPRDDLTPIMTSPKGLMPMIFASHGTPLMSITDCESTSWWREVDFNFILELRVSSTRSLTEA
jgi:hypothetical protein